MENNVIFQYTRQNAIDDGELRDVSTMAKEANFKIPVAVTRAVWHEFVEPTEQDASEGQSIDGRLWDVLWMLFAKIKMLKDKSGYLLYEINLRTNGVTRERQLKALCHGGDNAEPVMTIMLPGED